MAVAGMGIAGCQDIGKAEGGKEGRYSVMPGRKYFSHKPCKHRQSMI